MKILATLLSSNLRLQRPAGSTGRGWLLPSIAAGLSVGLAGCAAVTSVEPSAQTAAVHGMVHGGQQPVAGATVQLIAPGTTGYGSAGTVIVSTTTDGSGNFTLPRPYTCPANSGLVYLLATGGNPGAGTNSALAEAAILGPCSGLTSSTYVFVSEVTTVAAAYALAPFASVSPGTTSIGTSATNLTGLTNAAAAAGNLASSTTGQAGNSSGGVTLPTAEMNTLADILSACVNSNVAGVASTTCSTLFTAATPPGGTAPTDTFQAAIDIALNPGNNAAAHYALATASAPYQPTLTTAPGDFALGIVYSGGIIGASVGPTGIDIDATGNAWVGIVGGGTSTVTSGLVEISPTGVVSPSTGAYLNTLNFPQGVAINSGGLVEVADYNNNNLQEFSPPGATASGFSVATPSSLSGPVGIAIDNRDSSTWISNFNNGTLTHISQSGVELTASSPAGAGVSPLGIAVDGTGSVIVANSDIAESSSFGPNSSIVKYTATGTGYSGIIFGTGTDTFPGDIAIDNAGNIWSALFFGVGENSASAAQISPVGGYPSNSDNNPASLEIDGLGRAFVSNSSYAFVQPGTLTVFSNNGTLLSTANSSYGYTANGTIPVSAFQPHGLALDSSGNCWITGSSPNAVVELIGIAAPVATPLAVQNAPTNRVGVRP